MEPNVRLLRYFLAVADAGTFTAAAEVLHVSQPALSQQIKKLESELGFALFQRGTRHVTLTPHGKDLISSARQVAEAAETYRGQARGLAGGTRELTIGYRAAHESTRAVVDAGRARIYLADLSGLPWITTTAQDRVWQAHARPVAQSQDEPNPTVVVDTLDEFLEAVTAGRGVGLAPASASRLYARPGVAFIDVADAELSVGALAWNDGAPDANPTVAAFIRSARQFVHHQRRGKRAATGY